MLIAFPTATTTSLEQYYAPANGKKGEDLLFALHTIIRTGHVDKGYSQARQELFSEVDDLNNDNKVEDIFTGESRGPIDGKDTGYAKRMNTEHTWPQSKGATGIAQSDLHHLHAADIDTNEKRASYPYGDVAKTVWETGSGRDQAKLGVDLLGQTVFEPRDASKGDIARGLLYFYTRYYASRPSRFTLENFRHELPALLKWNKEDPVDDMERLRNDVVQKYQGNRNPFIDHPEWIDQADFSSLSLRK